MDAKGAGTMIEERTLESEMLESLKVLESRLTAASRAFYGTGKRSALQAALEGWVADIEPARKVIAKATGANA